MPRVRGPPGRGAALRVRCFHETPGARWDFAVLRRGHNRRGTAGRLSHPEPARPTRPNLGLPHSIFPLSSPRLLCPTSPPVTGWDPTNRASIGPRAVQSSVSLHQTRHLPPAGCAPTGDRGPCRIPQPGSREAWLFGIFRTSPVTSFRSGVAIKVVARLLTHQSSTTTSQIYVHLGVADVRAALQRAGVWDAAEVLS